MYLHFAFAVNFIISFKNIGSGGIRTHALERTGALNQRLRPLGHATLLFAINKFTLFIRIARTKRNAAEIQDILNKQVNRIGAIREFMQIARAFKNLYHHST